MFFKSKRGALAWICLQTTFCKESSDAVDEHLQPSLRGCKQKGIMSKANKIFLSVVHIDCNFHWHEAQHHIKQEVEGMGRERITLLDPTRLKNEVTLPVAMLKSCAGAHVYSHDIVYHTIRDSLSNQDST